MFLFGKISIFDLISRALSKGNKINCKFHRNNRQDSWATASKYLSVEGQNKIDRRSHTFAASQPRPERRGSIPYLSLIEADICSPSSISVSNFGFAFPLTLFGAPTRLFYDCLFFNYSVIISDFYFFCFGFD